MIGDEFKTARKHLMANMPGLVGESGGFGLNRKDVLRFWPSVLEGGVTGRTNMLDHPEVTRLTAEMGYPEVVEWLADHRREYAAFVLEGTRPLGKNFGGKEDPAPCADK